jgi:predicted nucleic acid-binding protein
VRLFPVTEVEETSLPLTCRDPRDNKFLALVLGCSADVLVSSDDDLLVLNPYQGIPVLTPKEFLL